MTAARVDSLIACSTALGMGAKTGPARLVLLVLAFAAVSAATTTDPTDREKNFLQKELKASRTRRDLDENITTLLLVPARSGKSAPPVGILSKTARTFVQDGASTEYATQVVGTTLNNGRYYAKILSTSSRVFYDKDISPDESAPFVVYPSAPYEGNRNPKPIQNDPFLKNSADGIGKKDESVKQSVGLKEDLNDLKNNDIFGKVENEIHFKPAKVRNEDLPTYTVKQDYVTKDVDIIALDDEQHKAYRPRVPKIFKPQPKVSSKKQDLKPLSTVTYRGFADFTTTVSDTVIVFSPSTAPAPVGRPATTIKGDATLRPDDGVAILKIKPTSVHSGDKPTATTQARSQYLDKEQVKDTEKLSSIFDLQPSTIGEPEAPHSDKSTSPLLLTSDEKTGLIKVIDSTTSSKGTTTHYMSSIYGTYVGTNYAQITITSSNVYFYPDDSTSLYENVPPNNEEVQDSVVKNNLRHPSKSSTTEEPTENELGNDVIPLNRGRSIKGLSPKNQFSVIKEQKVLHSDDKLSLATRLLPSTIYKTFTYFTTFFIPNKSETSTSVKSREVVSSEITYLTELILPTSTQTTPLATTNTPDLSDKTEISSNTKMIENTNNQNHQEVEEIQLIFKTIFTTFTYLTTFYDESTTSVSSRKVTATNVITQTIDPFSTLVDTDGYIEKDTSTTIVPTKVSDTSFITSSTAVSDAQDDYYTTVTEDTTENIPTDIPDQLTTIDEQSTTEPPEPEEITDDSLLVVLEPSSMINEPVKSQSEQLKTYYTTYTYFTTIIVDDETEIETRTEVFSNFVTDNIQPTSASSITPTTSSTVSQSQPPPEILAYLNALKNQKSSEEARLLAKQVQEQTKSTTEIANEITTEDLPLSYTDEPTTMLDDLSSTEKILNDGEVLGSMKTDVIFSSSSGGSTVIDVAEKRNGVPEDQELSETNHHDVEPAPTLLLQTSYTTYTYFTTMYNGDATDVVSRLDTVTNIVTETIKPTAVLQPESKTLQPLTYFTTFTYWTTFIKGDETATTSREETVSNVVTPGVSESSAVQLDVVKTYRPFVVATPVHNSITEIKQSKATSDNEVTTSQNVLLKEIPTIKVNELRSTLSPEPVTLYTTYTYFTTSYVGNSTILNSRLETITSVSYPDDFIVKATPRAIGKQPPSTQVLNTEEKVIEPSKVDESPKTGLLSTIRLSQVNDGTTTHFMTDIYGTYIDGLYAQVVETSTQVEQPTPIYAPSATPVLPTGILSLNKGSIIDADEITTVYYTTKQIGSSINDLYVKVIESTSSTEIDNDKLITYTPVIGHKTGLVRLIKGLIETNDTTTYYESKVIGTSINGRYAQIIESTSSYLISKPTLVMNVNPTSTLPPNAATDITNISPSPAVIQSSISEDTLSNDSEQEDHEEDDESDEQKLKKKSRLTFSSRKRTSSTPPIRPFASRSRPTFNPKRKPQGATTITRSDITPTVTATLAGKGSRFSSSRGRSIPTLGSAALNPSSSRRFSGRKSSLSSTPLSPSSQVSGTARSRGSIRGTSSSTYAGSRRGSTSVRGSSIRPTSRGSSTIPTLQSTRYRPGIRPSSILSKVTSTIRQDDQEDNANEYTTATLITEETPVIQEESEDETAPPSTTTESSRKSNNPLLRFRRPHAFGSGVKSSTPKVTTTTAPKRTNNVSRSAVNNRTTNVRARPTVATHTTKSRQSQSNLFPPRTLFGRKPDVTEPPVETKNESVEDENFEDEPVKEITDNDYEGSEQQENAPLTNQKTIPNEMKNSTQIKPFTRVGRGRRVRRQTNQTRPLNSRFRRPISQTSNVEDDVDSDSISSKEDISKVSNNDARYNTRARILTATSRPNHSANKEDKSSEEYFDNSQIRTRSKATSPVRGSRVKPSHVNNSNRQFTLREKEGATAKPSYKRNSTPTRGTSIRTRNTSRSRTGTNRYQDSTNSRRTSSRTGSRGGARNSNRRITPSRGRLSSHEDYRDDSDFDGTITVTHYIPTEVTIPVVNNGITEKRNIITAQASTEVIGPDRYSTIMNSDGRDVVVLASEKSGTNFHGQLEVTRFFIHETPTTKVSHVLTSSGGRRFSQPIVVPSTVYSIENVVSTSMARLSDSAPLANIILSQLLRGQFGQPNPLVSGSTATPSTRYDTRATTYVTTITKHQSTIIPLTFRGKEILTTLVDTTTDVVTATEFITDTIVSTPTLALPAANLNSLLLLLQQPQAPQQPNPLSDPLLAAAPFFSQSNTLPGEVERRNQPVDSDYKPDSYEDLSDEEVEKSSKGKGSSESSESSVITLYVSGRRPGEFSTILSTVTLEEEATSTRVKRHADEVTVTASLSPSFYQQAASEPVLVVLDGSEEPIGAHAPTQSLESVVGDVGRHISTSVFLH
ncbi:mucin-3A-like [Copidosoma floridanum]|uniref:mucin-3A-like n=1 Tax=Copidosoma floridanum TaxID=29053 RepID=UPI0006C98689|nr:mucin-3A-like [Copidosoma floridanum]